MGLIGTPGAAPKAPGDDDLIKDASIATFARDVMEASQQVPILVDFWAPWCGPCRQLTPTLEKVVRGAKGKIRLVKINIDENPELAQQLRIQSVPTVYAFWQGQPLTGFAGAQPESQIRAFVDKLIAAAGGGAGADGDPLEDAKALMAEGQIEAAAQVFSALYQEDPEKPEVIGGLARAFLALGRAEDAKQILDAAPQAAANHTDISGAKAALSLAEQAGAVRDPQTLQAVLARAGDDHATRVELADSLFLRGQPEAAMDELLTIVKRDREWNDDAARRRLLTYFEALGHGHALTLQGRRKLSSVLFS